MEIIKSILFFWAYFLLTGEAISQDLVLGKLTAKDKANKVKSVYEYHGTDHYSVLRLQLCQNGTFRHTLSSFNQDIFSEGNWIQKDDTLILINSIRIGEVPIELSYSMDTAALLDGFKVGIVRNLKGDEMPDGLVVINNDSVKCAPSYGMCTGTYSSIDSIKVVFENGLYSKWLKLVKRDFVRVIPVVQTDFLISAYMPFDDRKYLIRKSTLKPLD